MSDDNKYHVARIDQAVDTLCEYFDTVHIFVTASRMMDGEEHSGAFCRGKGHFHTRYGQIREWLVFEDEKIRQFAREVAKDETP